MEDLTLISTVAVLTAFIVTGTTLYALSKPGDRKKSSNEKNNMIKRKSTKVIESPKDCKSSKYDRYMLPSSDLSTPVTTSKANQHSSTYKGYTTDSKGNIRTYFHREVTPEDKALLGDCTPKLLSRATAVATPTPTKSHQAGNTSARTLTPSPHAGRVQESLWNAAGTWEERDYSKWGKSHLKALLEHIEVLLPDKLGIVSVTEVSHIEGDASMVHIRGRNKFIYDFSLHVHWKATIRGSHEKSVLEGKFVITEITGDCMYDIKSQIPNYNVRIPEKHRQLVDSYILSSSQGIRREIMESLNQFLRDFQTLYKSDSGHKHQ